MIPCSAFTFSAVEEVSSRLPIAPTDPILSKRVPDCPAFAFNAFCSASVFASASAFVLSRPINFWSLKSLWIPNILSFSDLVKDLSISSFASNKSNSKPIISSFITASAFAAAKRAATISSDLLASCSEVNSKLPVFLSVMAFRRASSNCSASFKLDFVFAISAFKSLVCVAVSLT